MVEYDSKIQRRIESWKDSFLDPGKRNRLLNYKETKRSNINIIEPDLTDIYKRIVLNEEKLTFKMPISRNTDRKMYDVLSLISVIAEPITVIRGDIKAEGTSEECKKTLKNLRAKAKLSLEEQGINILYLACGFLRWRDKSYNDWLLSPLVLVPVSIEIESINAPYTIKMYDDEIVLNPTLTFILEKDYAITLPAFDSNEDEIETFMGKVEEIVNHNGWRVVKETSLSLLSFLKINMYKDLEMNKDCIVSNPVIRAMCGEKNSVVEFDNIFNNYNYDRLIKPIDAFQVVDADSSQQDAILLSKKNVSFVMQGPPGTGKSQTITNIIAEALGDGKKVLFVSEKMAALEVVHKRLAEAGLSDFCLAIHSHKANKKDILDEIGKTLLLPEEIVNNKALAALNELLIEREKLNKYDDELYTIIEPLGMSIYQAYGQVSKLSEIPDVSFTIDDIENITSENLSRYQYAIKMYINTIENLTMDYYNNPWENCTLSIITHEKRLSIESNLKRLCVNLDYLGKKLEDYIIKYNLPFELSLRTAKNVLATLEVSSQSPMVPLIWFYNDGIEKLVQYAENYEEAKKIYDSSLDEILKNYSLDILQLDAKKVESNIVNSAKLIEPIVNNKRYIDINKILLNIEDINKYAINLYDDFSNLYNMALKVTQKLDIPKDITLNYINKIVNVCGYINQVPELTEIWFRKNSSYEAEKLIDVGEDICIETKEALNEILTKYKKEIIKINSIEIFDRFNSKYKKMFNYIEHYKGIMKEDIDLDENDGICQNDVKRFSIKVTEIVENITNILNEANKVMINITKKYSMNRYCTIKDLRKLNEVSKLIISNIRPTEIWFNKNKHMEIQKIIAETKEKTDLVIDKIIEINKWCKKDIFSINYLEILKRFESEYNNIFEVFKLHNADENDLSKRKLITVKFIPETKGLINNAIKLYDDSYSAMINIIEAYDLKAYDTINETRNLCELCKLILSDIKPTELWFNRNKHNEILEVIKNTKERIEALEYKINKISSICEKDIFDIDYLGMLNRFKVEYINIFKVFKKSYRNDKKIIRKMYKNIIKKLTDEMVVELLIDLKEIDENKKWLSENDSLIKSMIGTYYLEEETNWDIIQQKLQDFDKLMQCFSEEVFPKKIKQELIMGLNENSIIAKQYGKIQALIDSNFAEKLSFAFSELKNIKEIPMNELIYNLKYKNNVMESIERDYSNIISNIYDQYISDIYDEKLIELLKDLQIINENKKWLSDNYSLIRNIIGDYYLKANTKWDVIDNKINDFNNLLDLFENQDIPIELRNELMSGREEWDEFNQFNSLMEKLSGVDIDNAINMLFYDLCNVESMETTELLKFITNSEKVILSIEEDYNNILLYFKNENEITSINHKDIKNTVSIIKKIRANNEWLNGHNKILTSFFQKMNEGINTKWEKLREICDCINHINDFFGQQDITQKTKDILIGKGEKEELMELVSKIQYILEKDLVTRVEDFFKNDIVNYDEIMKVINCSKKLIEASDIIIREYSIVTPKLTNKRTYIEIISDLNKLSNIQNYINDIQENTKELNDLYEYKFIGIDTNWTSILNDLNWIMKFKKICLDYGLNNEFIVYVCTNKEAGKNLYIAAKQLKESYDNTYMHFEKYDNLFENELSSMNLKELVMKIQGCCNITLLDEWINYKISKSNCLASGLGDFIEKIEKEKLETSLIMGSFLKRFYKLWLDTIIVNYPAILEFHRIMQDTRVERFVQLDEAQFTIARARLRELLIKNLPKKNKIVLANDELSILKHELNKKRKIMPLRKLFKSIPNLLMTLKPCLMMSPLSVSYFLEAQSYSFDMVIFDEASQIHPQDSIGAIFRGKQVIIAGDTKQLPPTSFFAAHAEDSNFDEDGEEDEDNDDDFGVYDSILEEMANVLPERTLLWHYRSRNEDLISFSNKEIYDNMLTTFPSDNNAQDNGVEYVYVENGVYEKNSNKLEANKVVELIKEHIDKYPERSLGVITFSQKQQGAIEDAISNFRIKNPIYEAFFDEKKQEAFFVKNLENVQGDERDTIIFSIGYAKNAKGIMYMRFGPLGHEGGYRRLNVAITRAKYNVKLVGSIKPYDIDLSRTKSEGVKMLRSYIEFAINRETLLSDKNINSNNKQKDLSFEETIIDVITKAGYKVDSQVGNSEYKIDIAVKHPQDIQKYVIGIECDGHNYHLARTARDRDRLRQNMLKSIGWKLYRIWSTEWIKDPIAEEQRLLNAIQQAIEDSSNEINKIQQIETNEKINAITKNLIEVHPNSEVEEASSDMNNPYEFEYYKEAILSEYIQPEKRITLCDVIKFAVEKEQPMHRELLYKRLACIFGNQKATIKVRRAIDSELNFSLKDDVEIINDFCWSKLNKAVKVRIPEKNGEIRPINHICKEELAEAMKVIAERSIGINEEELFLITAREFGFQRCGDNIKQAMIESRDYLINSGCVRSIDGKILREGDVK